MQISRTGFLALRAMLFIASRSEDRVVSKEEIARALGGPENYLGKVLNRLRGLGLLASKTGPGGGYRLNRNADEISLPEILREFEIRNGPLPCLLGKRACDLDHPCGAHAEWQRLQSRVDGAWATSRLSDFLAPPALSHTTSTGTDL